MASYYWAKFYIEILDDPKMGRLPDRLWRRTCELILLAKERAIDGSLPPLHDMAWRLRLPEDGGAANKALVVSAISAPITTTAWTAVVTATADEITTQQELLLGLVLTHSAGHTARTGISVSVE